jgi:hypothetical protein
VNWKSLVVACWIGIGLAGAPAAVADAASTPSVETESQTPVVSVTEQLLNEVKHPVDWFTWGADLRVREEYVRNARGLQNNIDDTINMLRVRPRIWADFGPFLSDPGLGIPNGLDFYVRLTDETRFFMTRPTVPPFNTSPATDNARTFNEIIVDNLYANWDRPAGLPVSFRAGRQDLMYGRGWVILDGTPLDGSRTIYSDAFKMTLHADPIKTDLDLFVVDNKAYESRLQPVAIEAGQQQFTSEYDTRLLGAYLISKRFAPMEINAYYIYKDDTLRIGRLVGLEPNGRIVHTVGGLVQGTACTAWDYYAESAYQWGNEGAITGVSTEERRQGYGFTSDLGYTFKQCPAMLRLHGGYETLSGDDPHSQTYGGWDPVMSRWPECSELYVYRWQFEGKPGVGVVGAWSNLQRLTLGASAKPTPKMTTTFDYNLLFANERNLNNTVKAGTTYGNGYIRGSLLVAKLLYDFNSHLSGHLWAEYFEPADFYSSKRDGAVFLRWELMFKL